MKENGGLILDGTRCKLVPYTRDLVPMYHSWFVNDSSLLETTCSELLTLEEEFANQESWRTDPDKLTFLIRDTVDGNDVLCGDINCFFSDFFAEDWTHDVQDIDTNKEPVPSGRVGEINMMIAEKSSRRKGIAEDAFKVFEKYMLEIFPDLKLLVAKIQMDNIPSISLFKKLGFGEFKTVECFNEVHLIKCVGHDS